MHEQLTEWWNGVSLRNKITGVTVMLLTLGLLVAGVGTMSFLRNYLLDEVNDQINTTASDPTAALGVACGQTKLLPATHLYIAEINARGEVICPNNPPGAISPVVNASTLPKVITQGKPFTLTDKQNT